VSIQLHNAKIPTTKARKAQNLILTSADWSFVLSTPAEVDGWLASVSAVTAPSSVTLVASDLVPVLSAAAAAAESAASSLSISSDCSPSSSPSTVPSTSTPHQLQNPCHPDSNWLYHLIMHKGTHYTLYKFVSLAYFSGQRVVWLSLQCFDTVGWATGIASSLKKS